MSFTYDPAALSVELNRIRLEIGDVDENDPLLQDEEIAQVQSEESAYYARVAKCCVTICSKLAREVKHKLADFSEESQLIYDRYKEMAYNYARLAAGSYPWMSSLTEADKESMETLQDTGTLVKPRFKVGMHDNQ